MPDAPDSAPLEARIAYTFRERAWLDEALTHRSLHNERPRLAPRHNERLEFLGDALLGVVVTTLLFDAFPDAREGELTRKRADLVREETLAEIALELGVGEALRLGRGEEKSGGREKPRLLASAVEALIGAIYKDGGSEPAHAFVRAWIEPRLGAASGRRDDRSRLQEWAQREGYGAPRYEVVDARGPDHAREFAVVVFVGEDRAGEGVGRSKAEAAAAAAREAYSRYVSE